MYYFKGFYIPWFSNFGFWAFLMCNLYHSLSRCFSGKSPFTAILDNYTRNLCHFFNRLVGLWSVWWLHDMINKKLSWERVLFIIMTMFIRRMLENCLCSRYICDMYIYISFLFKHLGSTINNLHYFCLSYSLQY